MKLGYLIAVLYVCPILAQAEIYKAVDENGHVTYSSTPIKGGKKLILEPLPTMMPQKIPADFPNVDSGTQRARDDTRRKILQDELNAEEKLFDEATQALNEGEATPEVSRQTIVVGKNKDGAPITETVTHRNMAKYDEKIKPLQEQVDLHKQNIEALKTELSKLTK